MSGVGNARAGRWMLALVMVCFGSCSRGMSERDVDALKASLMSKSKSEVRQRLGEPKELDITKGRPVLDPDTHSAEEIKAYAEELRKKPSTILTYDHVKVILNEYDEVIDVRAHCADK